MEDAAVPFAAEAPPPAQEEGDAAIVRSLAGFGTASDGVWGAVRYAVMVFRRWLVLRRELAAVRIQIEERTATVFEVLEALGRKAGEIGLDDDRLAVVMAAAARAQDEIDRMQKDRVMHSVDHRKKREALEAALALMEQKIAPARIAIEELTAEKLKLEAQRKRVETRMKRVQIDLRNTEDIIRKRQDAYADQATAYDTRDGALTDIEKFDKRCGELTRELAAIEAELRAFDGPMEEAEYKIGDIRGQMTPDVERMAGLQRQIGEIDRKYSEQDEEISRVLDENLSAVQEAWATVGERILEENVDDPRLAEATSAAADAARTVAEFETRRDHLRRAMKSYDRAAMRKAALVAVAAVGVLVLATGVAAISM